jgi:hypothetical protein
MSDAKKREPLRLQSKYRNHTVMVRPTTRKYYPEMGLIEPVPGLFAKFEGPARSFDSELAQQTFGWTDEERDQVERKLVQHTGFMTDYFPAAMSTIPEHLLEFARNKPPASIRHCQAFGWSDGVLVQCSKEALPGIDYCVEHDPDTTKIVQGRLATTKD